MKPIDVSEDYRQEALLGQKKLKIHRNQAMTLMLLR
jgi:hypothetical protein